MDSLHDKFNYEIDCLTIEHQHLKHIYPKSEMFCLLRERNKFMVQKYAVIQRENSLLFQRRGKVYYPYNHFWL